MSSRRIALLVIAAVVTACASASPSRDVNGDPLGGTSIPVTFGQPRFLGGIAPSRINPLPREDGAACALGFVVAGDMYIVGCAAVIDERVTTDVVAAGVLNGEEVTVRRVDGVDVRMLMAHREHVEEDLRAGPSGGNNCHGMFGVRPGFDARYRIDAVHAIEPVEPVALGLVERLIEVAPDSMTPNLVVLRNYLASGAIDSEADPESNLLENWPAEVQAAITNTRTFATDNC